MIDGSEPLVELRPIQPGDDQFLFRLYASTRAEEMALVDWSEAAKTAFLAMQYDAQRQHYHTHYTGADFQVILLDGEPVGRLYLARCDREIRIVDIALLPQNRNQGIGSYLLSRVLREGAESGRSVSIHVEMYNPAQRLYERLGFTRVAQNGIYWLMKWSPTNRGDD